MRTNNIILNFIDIVDMPFNSNVTFLFTALSVFLFMFLSCDKIYERSDREGHAATDSLMLQAYTGDSLAVSLRINTSEIEKTYDAFLKTRDTEKKIMAANRLLETLYQDGSIDSLIVFAPGENLERLEFYAHYYMGEYFILFNRFDESIRSFEWARSFYSEKYVGEEALSDLLSSLSVCLQRKGEFHRALEAVKESYALDEVSGDKERISTSLNNMAALYLAMKQPKLAKDMILKAIGIERELNRDRVLAIRLGIASEVYLKLDDPRKSLEFSEEAYRLDMGGNRPHKAAVRQCQMASAYYQLKEYDRARQLLDEAIPVLTESGNRLSLAIASLQLGGVHEALGNRKQALEAYRQAISDAVQVHARYVEKNARYAAYKVMRDMNDPGALLQLERYTELNDSMYRHESEQMIEQYYALYKTEEISKESEKHRESLRVSIFVGVIVAVVLLAIVLFLIYLVYLQRLRSRMMRQVEKLRTGFFTNITHELRTPLTVILGLSRNISEDESLPEKTRLEGSAVERQGNQLLTLINQLLDISKVRSALGEPDWRHGDMTAFIGMIIDGYREYAREKEIDLQYVTDRPVEADFVPDYVNKILNNLLSNAFKFTPANGRVRVNVTSDGDDVTITVADTGKGIPKENLAHVFDPFYQGEYEGGNIGTGVGLALVWQIVRSVDGEVSVKSEPDKGSAFTVRLPKRHGDGKWKPLETREPKPIFALTTEESGIEDRVTGEENRTRLLIIEDNNDVARYIGSQISDEYDIFFASDGRHGLEKAREIVPDLMITDLMMPEMDGLEVCRSVRADELISHVPIIVITAKVTDADRVKGLEAGADAYLGKPFNGDELRVRIRKLLEQRRFLREKFSKALAEGKEAEVQHTDADNRFLSKTVDAVYLLMDKQQLDVNALADKLCLSPRQFHRKITGLTGETPMAFVMQIRMKRAKQLLDSKPEWSIDEVAERCGFDHYSGFYHAFKKMFGISPSQYRRRGAE